MTDTYEELQKLYMLGILWCHAERMGIDLSEYIEPVTIHHD